MGKKFTNPYILEMDKYKDIIITEKISNRPDKPFPDHQSEKVIIDIGCGSGNFLRKYAQYYPGYRFYGFELRFKRLVKGAVKFRKRDITNIRLIRDRAENIRDWIKEKTIDEIYVNFPDPWAKKKKQLKHRLITKEYLTELSSLLKPTGHFIFKTDHPIYFQWTMDRLNVHDHFKVIEYSDDLHHSEYDETNIPTEFEQLFRGKGFPVYYVKSIIQS